MDNDVDQALVDRYRSGDREAFTELVIRYQRPVYNAAYWILRSADDASDIAQDVFLKVAERLDEYDSHHSSSAGSTGLPSMSPSICCAATDTRSGWTTRSTFPGRTSANPESQATDAERTRHIQRALMDLSVNDRTVLVLRHFSDCSYEEIAGILDLDEKTVKSRLFEARHRLRETLKDFRPG